MSIKYGHDDDRIATQYAMAHIVRGMNHPSQVIQVGDQIMTIGVDQSPARNGVGTIDARLRNIDQIPPVAREIALKAAQDAVARAGSPPVEEPIRKALGNNLSDSQKQFLDHVSDRLVPPGPNHVHVHYINDHGEEAVHHLQIGVNVGDLYKQDAERLRGIIPTLGGVHHQAATELLDSVSKDPVDNGYDHLAPGIKQHRASGALFVHGVSRSKVVISPGSYPEVKSSEKTIAKNAIRSKHLESSKIRQFAVGKIKGLHVNGEIVSLGDMNKAISGDVSMKKSAVSLFEENLEDFVKSHDKKPKLGSGARFKELEGKVGSAKLAAWIGRKKFGKKKFGKLSQKGKK